MALDRKVSAEEVIDKIVEEELLYTNIIEEISGALYGYDRKKWSSFRSGIALAQAGEEMGSSG